MNETRICELIKDDGVRCGSPALRGHYLCYFHHRQLTGAAIPKHHPSRTVPVLNSNREIRTAATNVMRALQARQITPLQARTIFSGLNLAKNLLASEHKHRRAQTKSYAERS